MSNQIKAPGVWPKHIAKVVIIGTGAVGVSLLPGWVTLLKAWYSVDIKVVLSKSAESMVSPSVLCALSENNVAGASWSPNFPGVEHKALADWADLIIVAPATANYVTKFAQGNFESLPLYIPAISAAPIVFAPSLPRRIKNFPAVKRALADISDMGIHVLEHSGFGIAAHERQVEQGGLVNIIEIVEFINEKLGR